MIPVVPKHKTCKGVARQGIHIKRKRVTKVDRFIQMSMLKGRMTVKGGTESMRERLFMVRANDHAVSAVMSMLRQANNIRKETNHTWTRQTIISRLQSLGLHTRESEATYDLITRWLVAKMADENFTTLSRLTNSPTTRGGVDTL